MLFFYWKLSPVLWEKGRETSGEAGWREGGECSGDSLEDAELLQS